MISLSEFIAERLEGTKISMLLEQRAKITSNASTKGAVIIRHLIKIQRWVDPICLNHHLTDVNEWVEQIGDLSFNGNQKLSSKQYHKYLSSTLGDFNKMMRMINKGAKFKKYRDMERTPMTDEELYSNIKDFLDKLSKALADDDYYEFATTYFKENK